jgi:branched-chain amino acid transport system substrate-binding protein
LQAGIGQSCQLGVDIAPAILKSLGMPDLAITNADTESNVETARARAEKLIGDGAQLLVGAFDSGQTTAIAQAAEQKGIPLVINIAAAPAITEQGYKFVFRNFPTAPMILRDAFAAQKEIFATTGAAPKTVVFMHVNDTYGTAMAKGIGAIMPSSTCRIRSPKRSPTIRRPATFRSRWRKPRPPTPTHCSWSAGSTTLCC